MPRDKTDTLKRIIPVARQEFLEKGFEKASLRDIAKGAGITAAGLYRHFADKEAMFASLVEPAATELMQLYLKMHQEFEALPKDEQLDSVFNHDSDSIEQFVAYIYDHFDAFKLLITCAEGTKYAGYMDELVRIEVESTLKFVEVTGNTAVSSGKMSPELLHIISNALMSAIFEVVRHDMPRKAAEGYIKSLRLFFTAGWRELLAE